MGTASLADILLRLNTGLVNLIQSFILSTNDVETIEDQLDYQPLIRLSDDSRREALAALRGLHDRLSMARSFGNITIKDVDRRGGAAKSERSIGRGRRRVDERKTVRSDDNDCGGGETVIRLEEDVGAGGKIVARGELVKETTAKKTKTKTKGKGWERTSKDQKSGKASNRIFPLTISTTTTTNKAVEPSRLTLKRSAHSNSTMAPTRTSRSSLGRVSSTPLVVATTASVATPGPTMPSNTVTSAANARRVARNPTEGVPGPPTLTSPTSLPPSSSLLSTSPRQRQLPVTANSTNARRLNWTTSIYSFASESTNLGEVPYHRWIRPPFSSLSEDDTRRHHHLYDPHDGGHPHDGGDDRLLVDRNGNYPFADATDDIASASGGFGVGVDVVAQRQGRTQEGKERVMLYHTTTNTGPHVANSEKNGVEEAKMTGVNRPVAPLSGTMSWKPKGDADDVVREKKKEGEKKQKKKKKKGKRWWRWSR